MSDTLLHIWRNLPMGRETLLQSLYFARRLGNMNLKVFRPVHPTALMYFDAGLVTLDLNRSYTLFPETSGEHLEALLQDADVDWAEVRPTDYTASTLPNLPTDFTVMTCLRSMSQDPHRIGLGHIGPKVRALVKNAVFPILIPSPCFRPWNRVAAFFGGSALGLRAVETALKIASRAEAPLTVYTQLESSDRATYQAKLKPLGIETEDPKADRGWHPFSTGSFEANLYEIPSDALVVVGAAGENVMRELIFGSKLESIQATLPNPILVVGPNCPVTL